MNIENAVQSLTDLSTVDDELANADPPEGARQLELKDRRAALRGRIPEIVLTTYDALARTRRRPVVVAVRSSHCGGCHLRIPPQLDSAIRRRESLSVCPHCRRLLYPTPPSAVQEPAGEAAQAAIPVRLRASTAKPAPRERVPSRRQPVARGSNRVSKPRVIPMAASPRRSARAGKRSTFALELELQAR